MSDKIFLDTNIVIYAHTDHDIVKQKKAQSLMTVQRVMISTQVLQEASNILNKKLKHHWSDVAKVLNDLIANTDVYTNNKNTVLKACYIAEHYKFSFYDSLIISAAIEAEATILYSEDMQHNQLIEKQLKIINPFKIEGLTLT